MIAQAVLTGKRLDLNLAKTALRDTIRHTAQAVALRDVERAVCQLFQVTAEALKSDSRARALAYPRMMAMYLARKHTGAAYSEIGRYFGGRNHSTVISAEKKVAGLAPRRGTQLALARLRDRRRPPGRPRTQPGDAEADFRLSDGKHAAEEPRKHEITRIMPAMRSARCPPEDRFVIRVISCFSWFLLFAADGISRRYRDGGGFSGDARSKRIFLGDGPPGGR